MKSRPVTLAWLLKREFDYRDPSLEDIKNLVQEQLEIESAQYALERAIKDEIQNEAFNELAPIAKQLEDEEIARRSEIYADADGKWQVVKKETSV